jgi:parafibromin
MSTSTAIQDNKLVQRKSNAPPIIIVPNSLTTPISILNVLKFLKDGEYVSAEELKKQGVRREGQHTFQRVEDDKNSTFVIVDSVAKFRESDWDRVVAVIALGQPWQFKDWKWSNPVDLFNNVCGVHIAWDDRAVDSNIQSWNCKVLKVLPSLLILF